MFIVGLTGSIGMGKSATARFFREAGVPVHDADAAVHRLYEREAVSLVEAAFPGTTVDGKVDRTRLSREVLGNARAMRTLEAIVHPLVREQENAFLASVEGAPVVVLDVPLLLEVGADRRVDAVVVVSAPAEVQRQRVLARPDMTADKLDAILRKQMPDSEKRKRAHFIVDSSRGFDSARYQVRAILRALAATTRRRGEGRGLHSGDRARHGNDGPGRVPG